MYTVKWNEFFNMDRGGSIPYHHTFKRIKIAKQSALNISNRMMVPGVVSVIDGKGKRIASYQQGKRCVVLFG